MKEQKTYVDVYYDDELEPHAWIVRRYYKEKDGSLVVFDSDVAINKKHAEKMAKEWKKMKKVI
jgi:hypothetical protein